MAIYDDSAIFRTRDGYVRPSDLSLGEPVDLLTVTPKGSEKYQPFLVNETRASYSTIRFSHGVYLNLGQENVMVGTIHTGWEGCEPQTTYDVVKDIRKNFKYQPYYLKNIKEEKEYIIDLEECTDKKSGGINIFNKDYFRFWGLLARTGRRAMEGYISVSVGKGTGNVDEYRDLIARLPVSAISTTSGVRSTIFYLKENWFTDLSIALCGYRGNRFIADDLLFHASAELADEFKQGFLNCTTVDPNPIYKINDRCRVAGYSPNGISDVCFLLRRAGNKTLLVRNSDGSFRIANSDPKWSQYIQSVDYVDVPQEVYEITPISQNTKAALWVNEILFQA